eukprot:TRINITY_DN59105_c0_g1_i1.p1 TRINITY_DN59105_c0_g1~~TRINITY_DN59105_c0_g1_i1.p1  ORF type:complete len:397 (+),score=59.63 TRINITY_DN59105_c0_g1_i1:156-1346(+)
MGLGNTIRKARNALLASHRLAPHSLVSALGQTLGLPHDSSKLRVALAVPGIQARAKLLAENLSKDDLSRIVGPHGLLAPKWSLRSSTERSEELSRIFEEYMNEIIHEIFVALSTQTSTVPVASWRSEWANSAVTEQHVRQLWGTGDVLRQERASWSHLGVGFSVIDNAVSLDLVQRARTELGALASDGALTDESKAACNPGSRRLVLDFSTEENRNRIPPALLELCNSLACLPAALQETAAAMESAMPGTLLIPSLRLHPSVMAATYGPGSYYSPHLDKYAGGSHGFLNSRVLTVLLYLNPEWSHGDGGELRLFSAQKSSQNANGIGQVPSLLGSSTVDHSASTAATAYEEDSYVDIPPLAGRIVMFRSRDVWHGIRELSSERWALTLWVLTDLES